MSPGSAVRRLGVQCCNSSTLLALVSMLRTAAIKMSCPTSTPTLNVNNARGMSPCGNPISVSAPAKPKPCSRPNEKATRTVSHPGHAGHLHEFEIRAGDDIYAWMEAHHDAADHVLCVVSDEYLKAPYSTLERNAALFQAAKIRTSFVLFVVVKPCRLPTLIDHIRRCELFGVPEEAART